MRKQDYIEKIATYIAGSWIAADEGNQDAAYAAKHNAMNTAKRAADDLGHTAGYWLAESQFRAADLY